MPPRLPAPPGPVKENHSRPEWHFLKPEIPGSQGVNLSAPKRRDFGAGSAARAAQNTAHRHLRPCDRALSHKVLCPNVLGSQEVPFTRVPFSLECQTGVLLQK